MLHGCICTQDSNSLYVAAVSNVKQVAVVEVGNGQVDDETETPSESNWHSKSAHCMSAPRSSSQVPCHPQAWPEDVVSPGQMLTALQQTGTSLRFAASSALHNTLSAY